MSMTAAILRAARELKEARGLLPRTPKTETPAALRFKPEMERRGDAADYRRVQGLGLPFRVPDLAENGSGFAWFDAENPEAAI